MTNSTGRCLCGQLTFKAQGDPHWVIYCHCASCRRHTASPVTCFVNFKLSDVSFSGTRGTFASSEGVSRSFCAQCGTPVAYETETRAGEIDLYVNVFDNPESFKPQSHVFFSEHVSWLDIADQLERREN